jgi:hypothetical protein
MAKTLIVAVLAGLVMGLAPFCLPAPRPVAAPAVEFSAQRAMPHIQAIASQAHPAGSPASAAVRDYLVQQMNTLGLQTEVQKTGVATASYAGTVENVLGRLPGTGGTGNALLILSHPDSTVAGPGAQDNASGSAVLLEVARALAAGPAPENDIIFLFDDGEEYGYLGGQAFATRHPWMADVRLAIGIDTAARSPAVLLYAGPGSQRLLDEINAAGPYPVASAFLVAVLNDVGKDTSEITPLVAAGAQAVELEDIYAFPEKHTAQDVPVLVDPAALQSMGSVVLALARRLGQADLASLGGPDDVFFTAWPLGVVHYPSSWSRPLAGAAALGFLALMIVGLLRRRLSAGKLGLGLLAIAGLALAAVLLGLLAPALAGLISPYNNPQVSASHPPLSAAYFLGTMALMAGLALGAARLLRRLRPAELALAWLLPAWLLLLVSAAALPALSYVFCWPLLLASLGWAWLLFAPQPWPTWPGRGLLAAATFAGCLLLAPNIYLGFLGNALNNLAIPLALFMLLFALLVSPHRVEQ